MRERRFSRTFLVSGGATVAGCLLASLPSAVARALGAFLLTFALPTFAVSATRHLLRGLLWRVGSRLLVSYLLVGVVPLPFLGGVLLLGLAALSGQLGARRAADALGARVAVMEKGARDAANGAPCADFVAAHEEDLPELACAPDAAAKPGVATAVERGPASWVVVTRARTPRGGVALRLPLHDALAASLTRGVGVPVRFSSTVSMEGKQGTTIRLDGEGEKGRAPAAPRPPAPPSGRGLLRSHWVGWFAALPWDVVDPATGAALADSRAAIIVRTSIADELSRLFAGARLSKEEGTDTGSLVLLGVKVLVGIVFAIYVGAAAISALLVLRIARATRRLSLGIAAVERGDFAFRAKLRGHDQLAGLVDGFNRMAEHLSDAVAERAGREALERELETARSLQRRLLPPADFTFPGLEIAADFRPAAAIGGDFYHLLPETEARLSVVVADVSGHGLPTGIVMAAAKASLSALAATGMDAPELLTHLDEEVRRSTEARTFVTLAHLRLDLGARIASFTNAGHLYPWVVRASGEVASLPNPARPLGLVLPATFRTVTANVATGDLWVLCSDGIIEARSPAGEEFGYERLERILGASAGATAAELSARILEAWRAHTQCDEPEDDRTLLVLRVL